MRVLITGSREWSKVSTIARALEEAFRFGGSTENALVHGHCPDGADAIADLWALGYEWKVTIERHPAKWDEFGKRAGFVRNAEMVKLGADLCLAFIKNESKGASMTARLAEEAGIETRRFTA